MLILLLGAAAVVAALPLLWWAVTGDRTSSVATRNLGAGFDGPTDLRQAVLAHSAHDRAISPAIDRLAGHARRLTPAGLMERLERRILLAGGPAAWPLPRVLAAKLVLGGTTAALAFLGFVGHPGLMRLVVSGLVVGFSWFLPDLLLYNAAEKRQAVIRKALPDTIDQMTVSVEAGLAFDAAVARAARSGEGPLNRELQRTLQDIQAGLTRREALHALIERTDVEELRQFAGAVVQAESFGVPIAQVLRIQATEQRLKRKQRAEESAMKLPVKIVFPLVMCILPVIFIVLLGPAAIRITETLGELMTIPVLATTGAVARVVGRSAGTTLADLQRTALAFPRPTPFATGFSPLDHVLNGGIRSGDLLLIGGKPGQGKTIAALQWARHMAATGHRVVFACYEHDEVTLLTRLLAYELGEVAAFHPVDELRLDRMRQGLRAISTGSASARDVLDSDLMLGAAESRLQAYADNLILVRASGTRTDLHELTRLVQAHRGERTALFVDYLQKVPVRPEPPEEAERVKRVAEGLKELALNAQIAVVGVAAADRPGLTARRLRLHHMRGSTALAYEADAAVILNEKVAIVAKAHLAYDTTRAAGYRRQVVLSVEKNRNGPADVDLEFEKDFANYRFHPTGRWVTERLYEEGTSED